MKSRLLPIFETKRLFLKEVQLSDAKNYQKHFAHWDIIQYMGPSVPYPYPKGGARDFLKNQILPYQGKELWMWGIFLKKCEKELIGCVHLRKKGNPGNRGFWLAKEYQGKGLMTEAVQPILDYGFNTLGFCKLILAHAVQNKASRRIKEKTGGRFIEIRAQKFANPDFHTAEIWELTKQDWFSQKI